MPKKQAKRKLIVKTAVPKKRKTDEDPEEEYEEEDETTEGVSRPEQAKTCRVKQGPGGAKQDSFKRAKSPKSVVDQQEDAEDDEDAVDAASIASVGGNKARVMKAKRLRSRLGQNPFSWILSKRRI